MNLVLFLAILLSPQELPDFSWAGYHSGEKEIPKLKIVRDIRDYGALGDGKTDATGAIQDAIDAGGVILIPEGRWLLEKPVRISRSRTVLKGAGSGKTVLVCPNSLADIHGPNKNWAWSGAMVSIHAAGKTESLGKISGTTRAGSSRLGTEGTLPVREGEWLLLSWFNDTGKDTLLDHLYGGVIPKKKMGTELQESTSARVREWIQVRSVEEGGIRIGQPLRIDIRPEWNVTLSRAPFLEECGLEGVTFEFPESPWLGHLKQRGYNGISLGNVINGWVRDIHLVNSDSGIFVNSGRYVTVSDILIQGKKMHHALSASWSADCLFTRWRIEADHVHGTTISWSAHGNVFSHGYGKSLAMDSHRAASFQNLHTAIVIEQGEKYRNPFSSGGKYSRGPHAAKQNVYWNIELRFPQGDSPVKIGPVKDWPFGFFVGWHGNRTIEMKPMKTLRQVVRELNRTPAIRDLHQVQLLARELREPGDD